MRSSSHPTRAVFRSALVLGATVVAGPAVVGLALEPLAAVAAAAAGPSGLGVLALDEMLSALCAGAVVAAYATWALSLLLALAETAPRLTAFARRVPCPALARTLAASALGVAVVVASAASADPGHDARRPGALSVSADGLAGLALPDRVATQVSARGRPEPHSHEVVRGDTLWGIAAASLPTGASEAAVDRAWRCIAHANRDVLTDPHLIFPGTDLRVPPLDHLLGEDLP